MPPGPPSEGLLSSIARRTSCRAAAAAATERVAALASKCASASAFPRNRALSKSTARSRTCRASEIGTGGVKVSQDPWRLPCAPPAERCRSLGGELRSALAGGKRSWEMAISWEIAISLEMAIFKGVTRS